MPRFGAGMSPEDIRLPAFVAKLMRAKTGHMIASFILLNHHLALRTLPKFILFLHATNDQPVTLPIMRILSAFAAVPLFALTALYLLCIEQHKTYAIGYSA